MIKARTRLGASGAAALMGLALAVEKFTINFRYSDTNPDSTGCNDTLEFNCDARFVFGAEVFLP